jgi:hypothetical protein
MGGTLDIGSEGKGELRGSWFRNGWTGKGAMNERLLGIPSFGDSVQAVQNAISLKQLAPGALLYGKQRFEAQRSFAH